MLLSCRPVWAACFALLLAAPAAFPAPPADADGRAALVGQPVELVVAPAAVALTGPRDVRQLVVTGKYADGSVRDLTRAATAEIEFVLPPMTGPNYGPTPRPPIVRVGEGLFLRGISDGTDALVVKAGGKDVRVPVTVEKMATPAPVSFRRDVVAALNVGGCNMGACHGTPTGKNGFRLSLRGFDPEADYRQLTRDQFGRRADRHDPANALLLLKGMGRVPHEGGARLAAGSLPAEVIAAWLAEGLRDDAPTLPPVKRIEVLPGTRVLHAPAKWQQLAVAVTFADGTARDVTRLTNFASSDDGIAAVSLTGRVEFKRPGEVAVLCRYLEEMVAVRLTYLEPRADFVWSNPPERNFVDTHVFAKLKQMSLPPSDLCTDSEFVRRAFLDACGRLPTVAETKAFLADGDPAKRDTLIDRLVTLPEFADFWALKWADVLRSSRKAVQVKGAYAFRHWLRDRLTAGAGIDAIARELLTASGNTFANPPANYYRVGKEPLGLAESTAQLFLGVRMQCAKCHNHPFERWTQDDYYGFAAWFARVKTKPDPAAGPPKDGKNPGAEVVFAARDGEVTQPRTGRAMPPRKLGDGDAVIPPGADRRAALADWLTKPGNPFFAKSVANRVWFHLLGRGIVDPVDDFRDSNPAANDALLDALANDLTARRFDLRHLVATVMKSRTYQLSARPNELNQDDAKYFSHAATKLLTAEPLLDALGDVTGVPEKFAGLPAGTRAVQLPDGEVNHPFLKALGQPARDLACECERETDGNLGQALQLVNGPTVNEKVRSPDNRLGALLAAKTPDAAVLEELYLLALARKPDADESAAALGHVANAADKRKAWEDVLWAVLNTREFLFRH